MTKQTVKVNLFKIVSDAVFEGAQFGVNRAFKHTNKPTLESIVSSVHDEVMNALCDVLQFDD